MKKMGSVPEATHQRGTPQKEFERRPTGQIYYAYNGNVWYENQFFCDTVILMLNLC